MATYDDFSKLEIRVGEILEVLDFPRAKNPSYKLRITFGEEYGEKWSAAQATNYSKEELIGKQILAIVNFPAKNIAGFMSECLVLGAPANENIKTKLDLSLLTPLIPAKLGSKVF